MQLFLLIALPVLIIGGAMEIRKLMAKKPKPKPRPKPRPGGNSTY